MPSALTQRQDRCRQGISAGGIDEDPHLLRPFGAALRTGDGRGTPHLRGDDVVIQRIELL